MLASKSIEIFYIRASKILKVKVEGPLRKDLASLERPEIYIRPKRFEHSI